MPAIRWMGLYGAFLGRDSLVWELTQTTREVSAEWTVKDRPFTVVDRIGLLVKSSAVMRRMRYDAYTIWPRKDGLAVWRRKRNKSLNPILFPSHLWEAICKPQYVGIVFHENTPKARISVIEEVAREYNLNLLMLQADRKTLKPWQRELPAIREASR